MKASNATTNSTTADLRRTAAIFELCWSCWLGFYMYK